jgi:GMP synthase-like glutamine amidotransferase
VVQHTVVCPPGRVGDWLTESGATLQVARPCAGEALPADLSEYAGLVVLGGEMGAYDDEIAPWLAATRALLAEAVGAGVCSSIPRSTSGWSV